MFLKVLKLDGSFKNFISALKIEDFASVSSADYRLSGVAQSAVDEPGTYTEDEIQGFQDDPSTLIASIDSSTPHPNAQDFEFGNVQSKQRLASLSGRLEAALARGSGLTGINARNNTFKVPQTEAVWGFALAAGESYPDVRFNANTGLGFQIILTNFTVHSFGLFPAGTFQANSRGNYNLFTLPNTRIDAVAAAPASHFQLDSETDVLFAVSSVEFVYGITGLTVTEPGNSFADANGVKLNFPAPADSDNPIPAASQTTPQLTFNTETYQRQGSTNLVLDSSTTKQVKLPLDDMLSEMDKWLGNDGARSLHEDNNVYDRKNLKLWTIQETS